MKLKNRVFRIAYTQDRLTFLDDHPVGQHRDRQAMIDWKRVQDLRDEIGAEGFDEVVALFLEEVETEIAALRSGGPLDGLGSRLHFLKGSAVNLGFRQFSEKCQAGEAAASGGLAKQVDIADILASYDTSKAAFLEGVSKLPAA